MIVLLLSILLIVTASFALNTYIRLDNASKKYDTSAAFEDVSHVSTTYVKGGKILMILVLVFSVLLFIMRKRLH